MKINSNLGKFSSLISRLSSRRGFTLIELLIVIAVLGVLAAGVIVAINPLAKINSANLAKAKTFAASIENNLSVNQVGKWSFEETASPSKDTSGYGNNGNWNGGTTWNNAATCGLGFGGCLSFDPATNGYVSISLNNFTNPTSAITISAWVKINVHKNYTRIVGRDGWATAGTNSWLLFATSTGTAIFGVSQDATQFNVSSQALSTGTWYHLAGIYDGSNVKLYVNGVLAGSIANSGLIFSPITALNISEGDGANTMNGFIDEVAIYNQALGLAQIQQLYAQGLVKHAIAYASNK